MRDKPGHFHHCPKVSGAGQTGTCVYRHVPCPGHALSGTGTCVYRHVPCPGHALSGDRDSRFHPGADRWEQDRHGQNKAQSQIDVLSWSICIRPAAKPKRQQNQWHPQGGISPRQGNPVAPHRSSRAYFFVLGSANQVRTTREYSLKSLKLLCLGGIDFSFQVQTSCKLLLIAANALGLGPKTFFRGVYGRNSTHRSAPILAGACKTRHPLGGFSTMSGASRRPVHAVVAINRNIGEPCAVTSGWRQ
jgi:hypothetical protein